YAIALGSGISRRIVDRRASASDPSHARVDRPILSRYEARNHRVELGSGQYSEWRARNSRVPRNLWPRGGRSGELLDRAAGALTRLLRIQDVPKRGRPGSWFRRPIGACDIVQA